MVKHTVAFVEDPGSTLSTHMIAQDNLSPVPGNLTPSSKLHRDQTRTWCKYMQGKTLIYIKMNLRHFGVF